MAHRVLLETRWGQNADLKVAEQRLLCFLHLAMSGKTFSSPTQTQSGSSTGSSAGGWDSGVSVLVLCRGPSPWETTVQQGPRGWNLRPAESVVNNNFFMRQRRLPAACEGLMGKQRFFYWPWGAEYLQESQQGGGSVWSVGDGLKLLLLRFLIEHFDDLRSLCNDCCFTKQGCEKTR